MVFRALFQPLVAYDPDLKLVGGVAESWQLPDDTTYVFKIHNGLKFHNGRDLTADDVKWTYEWQVQEKKVYATKLDPVTSIDVLDPLTLKISLKEPFAPFLDGLTTIFIVPKEAVDTLDKQPVGSGPFKFGSWTPNDKIVYAKNPTYWDRPKPFVDGMEVRPIPENWTRSSKSPPPFRRPIAPATRRSSSATRATTCSSSTWPSTTFPRSRTCGCGRRWRTPSTRRRSTRRCSSVWRRPSGAPCRSPWHPTSSRRATPTTRTRPGRC
jgi:ABC-type transport system substrate-binding protein